MSEKRVIISPFSRPLRNGERNPKNYPWWTEAVGMLNGRGIHTIQVGTSGEEYVGAKEWLKDLNLDDLAIQINNCDTWAGIDNFFNHYASYYGKRGVAVFGASDPNIYGYDFNINLLKGREYLRPDQFGLWESIKYDENRFVNPQTIVDAVVRILGA